MQFQVGEILLTRVLYVDVGVTPETVGLTADDVAGVAWAEPTWADEDTSTMNASEWDR